MSDDCRLTTLRVLSYGKEGNVSDRRDAIVRLLRTRDDHLPVPVHRAEVSSSGFVHRSSAQLICEDCLANDRVLRTCETCHGRGYTEVFRERDLYAKDGVLPFGFDVSRHEATRERDRQIDVLDRQLARPVSAVDELAEANAHPFAWELARKRMWRRFDYPLLDLALEQLRATDGLSCSALHTVYVYGWLSEPKASPLLRSLLDQGLAFLSIRLPDPVRAPAADPPSGLVRGPVRPEAGAATKTRRDEQMREQARATSASPQELAREFGVSISTVYRVVNGVAA